MIKIKGYFLKNLPEGMSKGRKEDQTKNETKIFKYDNEKNQ